jgi:hypothetical protein
MWVHDRIGVLVCEEYRSRATDHTKSQRKAASTPPAQSARGKPHSKMAEIRLHNTMGGETEVFVPLKAGEVRMYTCGPTVYDYAHIGTFRTFVFQDI